MNELKIGIQLWTLREELARDFSGTLRKVKDMGYDGVEFACNYGGLPPDDLAALLGRIGLEACGLLSAAEDFLNTESQAYRYAGAIGCLHVTLGLQEMFPERIAEAIDFCGRAGETAGKLGFSLSYHNHAKELQLADGRPALDLLYEALPDGLLQAEIDTYWVKRAGLSPVEYVKRHCRRLPSIHFKDMNPEDQSFTVLGEGCIDFPEIVEIVRSCECEWVIYEQDRCASSPLDCAAKSFKYLEKIFKKRNRK
jgi:sugar phosphate isomerase/epimerase